MRRAKRHKVAGDGKLVPSSGGEKKEREGQGTRNKSPCCEVMQKKGRKGGGKGVGRRGEARGER